MKKNLIQWLQPCENCFHKKGDHYDATDIENKGNPDKNCRQYNCECRAFVARQGEFSKEECSDLYQQYIEVKNSTEMETEDPRGGPIDVGRATINPHDLEIRIHLAKKICLECWRNLEPTPSEREDLENDSGLY